MYRSRRDPTEDDILNLAQELDAQGIDAAGLSASSNDYVPGQAFVPSAAEEPPAPASAALQRSSSAPAAFPAGGVSSPGIRPLRPPSTSTARLGGLQALSLHFKSLQINSNLTTPLPIRLH